MPFLSHAGLSLRYDRVGSGPPVMLIHGWTCNRTFWERQVQALRDRHTVITPDLRGHGESSHPRSGYTLGGLATDLEQLVRALGVPRIALVGWSMGGLVAQDLARRLGDRASALVLVGTTPGALSEGATPTVPAERAAEIRKAVSDDFRSYIRAFAGRCFKLGTESPLYAWAAGQMQKTPPHVAAACLELILSADLRTAAAELKVPTAVLHGRHDDLLPFSGGEWLAKHVKGATLTVFEQSGHAPFLEEPDAFNAALVDFLGRQ